jgi:mycothiol synthase
VSAVPGVAGSYRRLLGEPVLRGLAVADICARLPQGMVGITLLLIAAAHASMTTAGLVVAGYTVGQGVTGPLRGRLADRYGLARVCAACAGGYAAAVLSLLAGSLARAPAGALIAAAGAAGLLVPPLSPGMRSLWSAHAAGALRPAAFALDAAVFDLAYIAGPVLASALATGIAPAAAAGVLLVLTAAAVVIIGGPARRAADGGAAGTDIRRGQPALTARRSVPGASVLGASVLGALRAPALRRLLLTGALVSTALTAAEVALTGYVRHRHALWASGPLLAGISAGSSVGSLLLGARTPHRGTRRRLPRLLAWYALGLAALTCATVDAPLMAVAAPLAGLCLGPSLATLFGLASASAPRGSGTEAQAWLNSAMNGGAGAGAALAGALAARPVLALGGAAAIAAAAALTAAVAGRKPVALAAGRAVASLRSGPVASQSESGEPSMRGEHGLTWRSLGEADFPALTELARACLSADGGQPFAASSGYLSGCYLSGAQAIAGFGDDQLVCVSAVRTSSPGDGQAVAVTTGLVHPAWRRRGIGGHAFDWAAGHAAGAALRAETETLSDGAHALYLNRGLAQVLAEDVMQLAPAAEPAQAPSPAGLTLAHWGQADPGRFFAVYDAAFRDRPGFPGWSRERWVEWITEDDDFRAELTLLASLDGTDVGFVVGDAAGWIAQLGVVPAARGRGIGAQLIGAAVRRMRAAGEDTITLNVNVDNPHAIGLYRRIGFTRTGRRAKYHAVTLVP